MDAYRRGDQFIVEFDLPGVEPPSSQRTPPGTAPASGCAPPSGPFRSRRSRPRRSRDARLTQSHAQALRSVGDERERGGTHDTDGFVLSAHPGRVAGAAMNNGELAAHQSYRPARPRLPTWPHVPGTRRLPTGPDGSFIPGQRPGLPPQPALQGRPRAARRPPHPHPTPHPTLERQSRTLHPHPRRRMGARPHLALIDPPQPRAGILPSLLQPPKATHLTRRPATHQPRSPRPRQDN